MIDVVVSGLAGARLVRAYQFETIGEFARTWTNKMTAVNFETIGESPFDVVVTDSDRVVAAKTYFDELTGCPHCLGFWLTLGCVLAYRWRLTRPLVTALAGSMLLSAIVDHYPRFDPHTDDDG